MLNQINNEYDIENIKYIINELNKVNLDILCFQEIHESQVKQIADSLWYKYFSFEIIADSHLKDWEKLSIAIISKYEILSSNFKKLTNPNLEFLWKWKKAFSHDKGFLEINIDYKWKTVRILSWHMNPFWRFWKDFMDKEFNNIRIEIEEIILKNNIYTVIWADMNFENMKILIPKIFDKWFNSVLENEPTNPKWRKIDKIIISKNIKINNFWIIKWKLDHYLCFSELSII